jgi:hypothetical protein
MLRPACWSCALETETAAPGVTACEAPAATGVGEPVDGCCAEAGVRDEETITAPSKTKVSSASGKSILIRTKFRTASSIPNLLPYSRRLK